MRAALLCGTALLLYSASSWAQEATTTEPSPPKAAPSATPAEASATPAEASEPSREELLDALRAAEDSAERAAAAAEETRALLLEMQVAEAPPEEEPEAQDEETDSAVGDEALRNGRWYLGGTVSLAFGDRTNSPTLLENVVESKSHDFRFQGIAGRLVIDRMLAVGAVLGYERGYEEGVYDSNGAVQERGVASNGWILGPSLRQFIRVGNSPIFFYYQADLVGGFEEESRRSTTADASSVRVANTYSIALNVTPGVAVFATDYFALELGVNVLGAQLAWTKSTTDYEIPGSSFTADINLNVDLLSLQFAFVGYF